MAKTRKGAAMRELTLLQQRALECLAGARAAGITQSAYAQSKGWELRGVYDALARLRRSGRAPAATGKRAFRGRGPLRFARVQVRERVREDEPRDSTSAGPQPLALRLRVMLSTGRAVEIEVEDMELLPRVLATLEGAA
jgi:hypothetical protein